MQKKTLPEEIKCIKDGSVGIPQLSSLLAGKLFFRTLIRCGNGALRRLLIKTWNCSDTTAPSLTTLLYLLARHPKDVAQIQDELQAVNSRDVPSIANLPHLNGAINEAMRLLPAVLTFVTRVSPPEGMYVDGTYIPGNIKLAAPRYSIGRRKWHFSSTSL